MTKRPTFSKGVNACAALIAAAASVGACGGDDSDAVSFVAPTEGESIAGSIAFDLAAEGVTVEPAGEVRDGAGHFHVVADAECVAAGDAIPRDVDHVHLGDGQSDGVIYLGPGRHELCVQLGDGVHTAQGLTDTVSVAVGIDDRAQWCDVVEEVDVRFEEVDGGEGEFAVQQAGYAGIGRLLDQMLSAMDHVDDEAREDVRRSVENAHELTDAYVDAADFAEAEEHLEPIFAGGEPIGLPEAVEWIRDTCGVDIDG